MELNGGYWETRGERRSRKRTNFFIEESKSPPKSSKKRSIQDLENNEGSESTSPPHKRSKVVHDEKPDLQENEYYDDQNTDPNIQSCNSPAYEPVSGIVVTRPDLASDTNHNGPEFVIETSDNNDLPQHSNMETSMASTTNNDVNVGALNQPQALTSSLAVPSLDKEYDSPIKEIKFTFPSEDSEATQPTDQPSLDAAVSTQTDGNSGLTNSTNSALLNSAQQSLMVSTTSVVGNNETHPTEASKPEKAPVVNHEDSSDILLINNTNAGPEQQATVMPERKKSRVIEDNNSQLEAMEVENESQIIDEIAEANNKEVVTIHSNQLANIQEVSKSRDNLGSDVKSERSEPKSSIKDEEPDVSIISATEIDLRGSNPKIIAKSKEKSTKPKNEEIVSKLKSLVQENYSAKDYSRYKAVNKGALRHQEREYCTALVAVLRSNEKIMNEYISLLPKRNQQMCFEALHAMEQSDESEVHELSQDMVDNAVRPATRSTTGPLQFDLQKKIMENPDIALEVLPAWRGDFVADEDDYGLTQDSAGLDAPRADNWSTPTSKKQKEEKLGALQKLKRDKENAMNKPKVVPKASNRPTKYVMPKFGEEESFKKKSNKISAGGYNIDAGYEDSDESDQDLEDTVPDDEKDPQEVDYNLPAYGPEFIEDDFDYGYQEKNPEKGGAGRAPKSPTKKTSSGSLSKNSNGSPTRDPNRHTHGTINNNANNVTPKKSTSNVNSSNTNVKANNSNKSHTGSNNTTPTKSPNARPVPVNINMGYSNLMPAVPVQTTLERSFFSNLPRTNSGGANDLQQALYTKVNENNNNVNNNNTNVVHLDSSPLGKNTSVVANQPAPTSPVAAVQYTGPKIKIKLHIPVLKNKSIIAFPTEDNNGVPMTVAQLKDHISNLNAIEVTALKLGDYQIGNNNDAVRDLLDPNGQEEIIVEAKDVKKSLVDLYKEKCQAEGIPINELLTTVLASMKPNNLQLSGKGVVRERDMEVLSTCIDVNVVEYLNLNSNPLSVSYFSNLERLLVRQNKSLRSLNLSSCSLDPIMFQALTSLNSLQELNISNNHMSDNIGVQFMATLPNLANLTNLDLSRCNIGPATMKALEDSRYCDNGIYPQNKGLAVISASFNKLQSVGVNHLVAALSSRNTTSLLTLKLQQVEILDQNDPNHCSKSLFKLMSNKTARLADLDLSCNTLTTKLRWIGQGINDSIHLHTIRLNKCGLNHESLTDIENALQFSQSLTCLELSDNILGKTGAEFISTVLQRPHKLQTLKLNSCNLTTVGLLHVLRSCHGQNLNLNVTRLELENNCDMDFTRLKYGDRHLTDAFSKLNAKLNFLELSRNGINDEDVRNAMKQSWEDIHGKENVSITMSQVSLRFMKKPRKN